MKANSPIKFTRYDDLNSSHDTGLKNNNKPITPTQPQPQPPPPSTRVSNPTSILKSSSVLVQSPQSPSPPNDIKYSSPVPKYNASMMMKTRNFNTNNSTPQSDTSRIDMMKR